MSKPILAMISGFVLAFGMFVGGMLFAIVYLVPGEPRHQAVQLADASDLWTAIPQTVSRNAGDLDRVAPRVTAPDGAIAADDGRLVRKADPRLDPGVDLDLGIDTMETASVSAEPEPVIEEDGAGWATLTEMPDDPAARRLLQAHVDWCARRYRSYQPADNSYSPYSGGRRACFSPYIAEFAAITGAPIEADPHVRFVPRPSVSAAPAAETAVDEAAPAVEEPAIVRVETRGITSDEVFEVREIEVADEPRRRPILDRLFGQRRIEAKDCSHYRTYDPATNTYQPYGGGPRRVCG